MVHQTVDIGVGVLLVAHAALLVGSASRHSPSIDEVGHLSAGLSHWKCGCFDLYNVNPPLARLVATAPVSLLRPESGWEVSLPLPGTRQEFDCGERLIALNGARSFWLFTVARWACIPFSLLGGYACHRWANNLYGRAGALLTLALWCFSPSILAHAQMITPDIGASALGVAACYLFWRWLRAPTWSAAFVAGLALGLAELTKTTFLVLYALWPLAWLVRRWGGANVKHHHAVLHCGDRPIRLGEKQPWTPSPRGREVFQMALMMALSLYILNVGYGFEGSFQPVGTYSFVSDCLGGQAETPGPRIGHRNRFSKTFLAGFRVPLPANYVQGIDRQKFDFEAGYDSYLRGEWRHGGWWYYYLYGLAIKVPLGTWILVLLAAATAVAELRKRFAGRVASSATQPQNDPLQVGERVTWRDEFVLLLPAAAILALVSSQTGFNHHLRYVLPIFPFVFIWIGRIGPRIELGVRGWIAAFRRIRAYGMSSVLCDVPSPQPYPGGREGNARAAMATAAVAGLALAWSIASSLWYYPHSLSYFNELVGGPLRGRWHLLDSNIDWGQDLLYLKAWLDEHPHARPLGLAYFGYFDPRAAGIEFSLPPRGPVLGDPKHADTPPAPASAADCTGPLPGWYAVSVNMLHGFKYALPDGKGDKSYIDRPFFTYFQRFAPVARAGYSIYIYHLEVPEVERVRREMGMPPLSKAMIRADRGGELRPVALEAS